MSTSFFDMGPYRFGLNMLNILSMRVVRFGANMDKQEFLRIYISSYTSSELMRIGA
jgi:hypothetical protein